MASYTKTNYMDPMALVTPAIGLVFWTSVVFILLIFILKKFAWNHILDSVDKRNKNIEDALQSAENAKKEMENLQAENKKISRNVVETFRFSFIMFTIILKEVN